MKVDIDAIERQLWPYGSNRDIWMILDGARDRRIYSDLMNSHLIYSCLYSGDIAYELEVAAPHLVQLEFEDKSTRSLIQRAWGNSWGIFLKSDARMERLRRHLRTLLTVRSWRGEQLLFRYYDPRILRVYLPTCTTDEIRTVYGPITHYSTETESGESMLRFDSQLGKLMQEEIRVAELSTSAG
jgi:hypothetical protein